MWTRHIPTAQDTSIPRTFGACDEAVDIHNEEISALKAEIARSREGNEKLKKQLKEAGE